MPDHIAEWQRPERERKDLIIISIDHVFDGCLHTFLATAELLNALLLIVLAVETDGNAHTSIVLHTFALLIITILIFTIPLVCPLLNDQTATASRDKSLENLREFFRNLLESALDGFVLPKIQNIYKLFDRRLRRVKLLPSLREGLSLRGEIIVLFKRLFIDVLVLLEGFVNLLQPRCNLN